MSLGIITSKIRRASGHSVTLIDGLPMVFKAGVPRFVDGRRTTDGPGLSFGDAHNTIQLAVTAAQRDDTIFVRPKNAGVRYIENVVIPATSNADHTKEGISIIGTGNGGISSTRDQAVILRGVTGVNAPAITANASYANFENLAFLSVPAQVGAGGGVGGAFGILIRQNSSTFQTGSTGFNVGSSIVNCGFLGDMLNEPVSANDMHAGIHFVATDGHLVENCQFKDCRVGILSSGDLTGNSCIVVRNNLFKGVAANIGADLYMIDVDGLDIVGNIFGHALPSNNAGSGGLKKYIITSGTVKGTISQNSFATDTATEATNLTIGSLIMGVNYVAGAFLAV